jgi:lipoprotein-anchoring transpeptidase ErfK/SrfK
MDAMTPHISAFLRVSRGSFKLHLWKRPAGEIQFKRYKTYDVAVGTKEYPTPAGMWLIHVKVKNPAWKMPDSAWVAEENRGKVIPGGDPANPLKARWLGVNNSGVGIHGTDNVNSITTRASHGCVRMSVDDVIELYDLVPLWSPIQIY